MTLVSSCSCFCAINWSQVLSREWRCSWSSADRRCSNYSWVGNDFIAYQGVAYIRDLMVCIHVISQKFSTERGRLSMTFAIAVTVACVVLREISNFSRQVLAFGYYLRLHLSVCVSVRQSRVCSHNNSPPVQARTTKFGQKMQNTSGLDTYFFLNLAVGQPSNNMDLSEIEIYLGIMIIFFLFR